MQKLFRCLHQSPAEFQRFLNRDCDLEHLHGWFGVLTYLRSGAFRWLIWIGFATHQWFPVGRRLTENWKKRFKLFELQKENDGLLSVKYLRSHDGAADD